MLINGTSPGNPRSKPRIDLRDQCGKLTLTAQDPEEARLLSMLYQVLASLNVKDGVYHDRDLYKHLRGKLKDNSSFPKDYYVMPKEETSNG